MQNKSKNSLFLLILTFVLIISISSVCAQDFDDSSDIISTNDEMAVLTENIDDSAIISSVDDVNLGYAENTNEAYIKFDQEDITITEGDSFTVTGSLVDSSGNNPDGEDFSVEISSNGKTTSKDLSNHKITYTFDNSWNFVANDNPYIIEFSPEDTMEYGMGFVEPNGGLEMVKSWVKVTVKSPQPILPEVSQTYNGVVSGGVDIATVNPWTTSGELTYEILADAKEIKNAIVYVNVYAGSGSNPNYALDSDTSITTVNGNTNLGHEILLTDECSQDGTVYTLNNHVTRVYSDYQILYNVTEIVKGLNGTSITIKSDSISKNGYQFDGRIKLIGIILAYDDGDDDLINYWVDGNQYYTTDNMDVMFDTSSLKNIDEAIWSNVVLSSTDAGYKVNSKPVGDADKHDDGSYYQFNQWTVTERMTPSAKTTLTYANNGYSVKSVLALLTVKTHELPTATVNSITPEYSGIAYPGTLNALTVKVTPSKEGKYIVKLLADDFEVNATEYDLTAGQNTLTIIDPTIRPLDETTVVNKENKNVKWTVEIAYGEETIATKDLTAKILYNGYLGNEFAYGIEGYKPLINVTFTGDIVVDIKGDSTYKSSGSGGRTDVWTVNLDSNSNIVGGFIIVPYNWFNYNNGNNVEDINMINATFNGKSLKAVAFAHDNPNLGWNYGYGSLVYDVSDLINASGENSLVLNRVVGNPALNPSVFVYYYNTTGSSSIKNLYMVNGYDLFNNDYNKAGRLNQVKSVINVNATDLIGADIYVFAAGADKTDGYIIVNDNKFENCWNGGSQTTDLFKTDITGIVKDSNNVSFVSTGATISSLSQFIVISKEFVQATATLKVVDNSKDIVYPGFNNTLTVTVNANKAGKYVINLLNGDKIVNTTEMNLTVGDNTFTLVDPTIRPLTDSAKYVDASSTFDKVTYKLQVLFDGDVVGETSYEAAILYNGYLGKDNYNQNSLEPFFMTTISGDIVILTNGTYATGKNKYDLTNFTVVLPENSNIVKAFIYVTYTYGGTTDNINMFNVTLNGNKLTPGYFARDASNLKANSGSGVVVFDVTDYVLSGDNVLDLNKTGSAGVYPTTLVYMYNTTGSKVLKNVYISNGADLLGSYGGLRNPIRADYTFNVDSKDAFNATAYIFANGAVDGRGTVVINGESEEHPWSGSSQSTDLYIKDITTLKDNNEISVIFSGTSGSFTVLQQIFVLNMKNTVTADEAFNVATPSDSKTPTYSINLPKDATGKFTVTVDGKVYDTKELVNGSASITVTGLSAGNHNVVVSYSGDGNYSSISKSTTVTIKENAKPVSPKITKKSTKIVAKNKKFKAKVKVKKYTITLKAGKKPVKKVWVTLKIKGKKVIKAKTNAKGKATFKIKKLTKKGKYKATIKFIGNKNYKASSKKVKITVKK